MISSIKNILAIWLTFHLILMDTVVGNLVMIFFLILEFSSLLSFDIRIGSR